MDSARLLQALSRPLTKIGVQKLAKQAVSGQNFVQDLLTFSFQKVRTVAFRASWVLEHVAYTYPDHFAPYLQEFIARLPEQHNLSCQRHFTKILMCCTSPVAAPVYKQAWLTVTEHAAVVETVFEWLIAIRTPVAVKVNCLDVLVNLRAEFPWVKEELEAQITFLLKDGLPAMQSRGKKLLQRLLSSNQ
ncbi:hypothetical protein [Pontibacter roseus]|uniref:hypothetical protein n=1 Tax=Pontibacter roseus TaxID=336989 RepID=UPI0003725072|nr:hypothetical protein [Pontibacter roseus]